MIHSLKVIYIRASEIHAWRLLGALLPAFHYEQQLAIYATITSCGFSYQVLDLPLSAITETISQDTMSELLNEQDIPF